MRMHSADCAVVGRLFVCLSVIRRYCVEIVKHIKLFHFKIATPFWFFSYQILWQYSNAPPPHGASNAGEVWKIAIFDKYLALSRKGYKIEAIVTMGCQ